VVRVASFKSESDTKVCLAFVLTLDLNNECYDRRYFDVEEEQAGAPMSDLAEKIESAIRSAASPVQIGSVRDNI
jgi:hypothetical protein